MEKTLLNYHLKKSEVMLIKFQLFDLTSEIKQKHGDGGIGGNKLHIKTEDTYCCHISFSRILCKDVIYSSSQLLESN